MKSEVSQKTSLTQFEIQDMNFKTVVIAILTIICGVVTAVLLLKPIFGYHDPEHALIEEVGHVRYPQFDTTKLFPDPRLQNNDRLDMETFKKEENEILSTYGWEDKSQNLVRVPIDNAMDLLLQKHLPMREEKQ